MFHLIQRKQNYIKTKETLKCKEIKKKFGQRFKQFKMTLHE